MPELLVKRTAFIAPAIDPPATENMELPRALSRPVLVQVSRFDPWKDPLGVFQAYRLVKAEMPGVQLALMGAMAGDDPEGWELLDRVEEESANDPDLYVFTNVGGVGSMEVNVFQRSCDAPEIAAQGLWAGGVRGALAGKARRGRVSRRHSDAVSAGV